VGLVDDLGAALDLMEEIGAPHMVVGGIALEALGVPRSTLDIDLQVRLGDPPATQESYFKGWFIAERTRDEVFGQDVLILEGKETGVPVEVFLTSHWFTEQALDRQTRATSGLVDREVPIPTPEDFILLKAAYQASPDRGEAKANQDRLDIEGVHDRFGDEIDRAYIEENARRLDVWAALQPSLET
jgi:hypothetical protein